MKQKNWTKKELEASVTAYIEMRTKEKRNEKFVKKDIYRNLSKRFGRSEGSFEYRMQNISYIYDEWGEPWIKGLKPYSHIGENIKETLIDLIKEHDPNKNKVRTYFSSTSSRIVDINEKNKNPSKAKRSKKEIIIHQNEDKLVQRYKKYLKKNHQIDLKKYQFDISGENSTLETDGWIDESKTLIEAKYFKKGESPRQKIRMAIGQLHDYKRHAKPKPKRLAILLPRCPVNDLVKLLHLQKIDIIYEEQSKFITKRFSDKK